MKRVSPENILQLEFSFFQKNKFALQICAPVNVAILPAKPGNSYGNFSLAVESEQVILPAISRFCWARSIIICCIWLFFLNLALRVKLSPHAPLSFCCSFAHWPCISQLRNWETSVIIKSRYDGICCPDDIPINCLFSQVVQEALAATVINGTLQIETVRDFITSYPVQLVVSLQTSTTAFFPFPTAVRISF